MIIPVVVKHKVQFGEIGKSSIDTKTLVLYYLVMATAEPYRTPAQLIEERLRERGWTQRVLALILALDETTVSKILSGKKPVDAELALTLHAVLDIDPEQLLQLQKSYELAKAHLEVRIDPQLKKRANLIGKLPIQEMIKRGWLDVHDSRNLNDIEGALTKFFGEQSPDDIEILEFAPKKTNVSDKDATPEQIAWLYRVKQIASELLVQKYSQSAARDAVSRLKPLLSSPQEVRKVPRILAESGIRFVIVESLPSAKIDGVCFWLNDYSPVIGMTLRFDRIDNFWFVLRHELEHVIQRHGRESETTMLDINLDGERAGTGVGVSDEERIANEVAADFCVPQKKLESFIARKAPFFAERDILGFANTLQVHPGLVAGQLQHKTSRYDRFRSFLVKVRREVIPSAPVDGWGDVYPVGL